MEIKNYFTRGKKDDLLSRWPKNEKGEPEEPMLLGNARNNSFGDELIVNMLEAYGIPCLKMYPGDGEFGKVVLGMSGNGSDIYVPASMFDDTVALCTAEPLDPDAEGFGFEE